MKLSLQSRVLALVGAGVFLAVAALGVLSRWSLLSLDREVQHDHERLAASFAREVSRALDHDLRLIAGAASAEAADLPAALQNVRRFGQFSSAVFLVDPVGSILACEPAHECESLARPAIRSAAAEAIRLQRPFVSHPVADAYGRQVAYGVITFRAFDGHGVAAGGTVVNLNDRRLTELLDARDVAPTLHLALLDAGGRVIAGPPVPDTPPSYSTEVPVPGTPWRLRVADTGPDPSAPITTFRRTSLWLAPTFALLAMVLGWGIARSVRRPLMSLTRSAERIAGGDLSRPIDTGRATQGGDEVKRLAYALERMRQELQRLIGSIEAANLELEGRVADRTRELAATNERLGEREKLRERLLRQVISAQEDERKRIARELHDETSQTLAALGIGVDVAMTECPPDAPERLRTRLQDIRGLVVRMHDGIHRLIVNLRPSVLDDLGLAAAIRWFADYQLKPRGIAVRCEFDDIEERLAPELETATFRAVQEAIVNISRHASAESVLIQGSLNNGRLEIEIEDDGVGFDPAAVERSPESMRGIGLLGMHERVEILGGRVTIESSPGSGARVLFSIPVSTPVRV
jgi:signal transduction histidine kinase